MRNDLFLKSDVAKNLYDAVRDLPIVDYHCHLSPKEILEDREFPDIAQIWLGGDHYKWRLMRACGVPEALITGDAAPREKFRAWAACLETAMGNPLYLPAQTDAAKPCGACGDNGRPGRFFGIPQGNCEGEELPGARGALVPHGRGAEHLPRELSRLRLAPRRGVQF